MHELLPVNDHGLGYSTEVENGAEAILIAEVIDKTGWGFVHR